MADSYTSRVWQLLQLSYKNLVAFDTGVESTCSVVKVNNCRKQPIRHSMSEINPVAFLSKPLTQFLPEGSFINDVTLILRHFYLPPPSCFFMHPSTPPDVISFMDGPRAKSVDHYLILHKDNLPIPEM